MSNQTAIYVRVPSDLLREFDEVAQEHGMSRSEAIREAMKLFIRFSRVPDARKLKGLLRVVDALSGVTDPLALL